MKWFDGIHVSLLFAAAVFSGGAAARADFTFGTPTNLGPPFNTIERDGTPCISPDGLSLFFGSARPGGSGGEDLYVVTRAAIEDEWGPALNLGPTVNSSANDWGASISADGLELFFNASGARAGGVGKYDIWVTTRAATNEDWGEPVNLGQVVNSSANDGAPCISADGLSLYFSSMSSGGFGHPDLWVTTRATKDDHWGEPVNLGPIVNTYDAEWGPCISSDGLILFFDSGFGGGPPRPGGLGASDLWMTRRMSKDEPWAEPVNLGPIVNTTADEMRPSISSDGSTFYFSSTRPNGYGSWDIWQAPIIPVVDFNGDGRVDGKDLLVMIAEFGGTDALCDIGPFAWGDGVVDFEDLKVLAEYIGEEEEIEDPTLIAHWPLDETEGMLVFDSVGESDAILMGTPMWQPDAGKVGGAIQCDGVDDGIITRVVPSLQDAPFSIVLWIKGGAPGQSIVAQQGAANWLYLNPADGRLMTGLTGSGQPARPLYSDIVLTDDQWHRIGLVWDGTKRILCVDGQEAASDEQENVIVSGNGLNIGCDCNLAPGSYFSGLIDDVRIYNRAIKP